MNIENIVNDNLRGKLLIILVSNVGDDVWQFLRNINDELAQLITCQ